MDLDISSELRKNLVFLGVSLLVVVSVMGAKNIATPNDPVRVGYTEVTTECQGVEAGVCLGFEQRTHTTYNYNNYTDPEPGTENYYREIESELMIRAYNTCNSSMSGMEWTDQVEYHNQTASEWLENENIQLLPCEKTFYRKINATS
ncbi:MAG: hypothetical protein ACI8Z7_000128 [Candidatus Nanohaloarchaea archaeon]|jgi:hypothetical protein